MEHRTKTKTCSHIRASFIVADDRMKLTMMNTTAAAAKSTGGDGGGGGGVDSIQKMLRSFVI